MSESPATKQNKLTIEDLVKAQEANERHLSHMANSLAMLASSTKQQHDPGGYRWVWAVLGGIALIACPAIPIGPQLFCALCLFVITWVMLGRSEQVSASKEWAKAKKQETTPEKKWFD